MFYYVFKYGGKEKFDFDFVEIVFYVGEGDVQFDFQFFEDISGVEIFGEQMIFVLDDVQFGFCCYEECCGGDIEDCCVRLSFIIGGLNCFQFDVDFVVVDVDEMIFQLELFSFGMNSLSSFGNFFDCFIFDVQGGQ